jgi:undecaprenyl-diphosphatase
MNIFQSIVLGIVEGLTEFLPISSTAHMKFVNPLLGVPAMDPFTEMFEVVIQLAAILAVVLLYARKFFDFTRIQFYLKLIVGVIPVLIVGALAKKYIDQALGNLYFISCVMIGGGIVLLFIEKFFKQPVITSEKEITYKQSFMVGCFQVLSVVFPGLSRSAATIIGGLSQKFTRSAAAEFSFFLAVPTMLAASVKSLWDTYKETPQVFNSNNLSVLGMGSFVSFVVALFAVKIFITFLKRYGFPVWGVYRIVVGGIMLALLLSGKVQPV